MSGRGQDNDPRGRRRWAGRGRGGRGRGSPPPAREALAREAKFKGSDPTLPTLNYGAGLKENRPIEFLQLFGEYCAINYNECIALAFRTSPPAFGDVEEEPVMPDPIPNSNVGKAMLAEYSNEKKRMEDRNQENPRAQASGFCTIPLREWWNIFARAAPYSRRTKT